MKRGIGKPVEVVAPSEWPKEPQRGESTIGTARRRSATRNAAPLAGRCSFIKVVDHDSWLDIDLNLLAECRAIGGYQQARGQYNSQALSPVQTAMVVAPDTIHRSNRVNSARRLLA